MDKKLTDMKVSRNQAYGDLAAPVTGKAGGGKVYPWGLEIRLDATALDKLGIKELPDAGAECVIHGVAKVVRTEQSATEDRKSRSLTLQITKLAISHEDEDKAFRDGAAKGPKRHKGY